MASLDLASLVVSVKADVGDALKNLEQINRSVDNLDETTQQSAKNMADSWTEVNQQLQAMDQMAGMVSKTLGSFLKNCVSNATDLEQAISKANNVFGEQAAAMIEWTEKAATVLGTTQTNALAIASTFADFSKTLGLSNTEAANMAKTLTQLSADVAAYKNVSIDTAAQALQGIFTGQVESMKNLGIVMNETTLKEYALASGITTAYSAMSQAEQIQLRYNYVMSQTADASGSFASSTSELAHAQDMLASAWSDLQAQLGETLLPMLTAVVQVITDIVAGLNQMPDWLKSAATSILVVVAALGALIPIINKAVIAIQTFTKIVGAAKVAALGWIGVAAAVVAVSISLLSSLNNMEAKMAEASKEFDDYWSKIQAAANEDTTIDLKFTASYDTAASIATLTREKANFESALKSANGIDLTKVSVKVACDGWVEGAEPVDLINANEYAADVQLKATGWVKDASAADIVAEAQSTFATVALALQQDEAGNYLPTEAVASAKAQLEELQNLIINTYVTVDEEGQKFLDYLDNLENKVINLKVTLDTVSNIKEYNAQLEQLKEAVAKKLANIPVTVSLTEPSDEEKNKVVAAVEGIQAAAKATIEVGEFIDNGSGAAAYLQKLLDQAGSIPIDVDTGGISAEDLGKLAAISGAATALSQLSDVSSLALTQTIEELGAALAGVYDLDAEGNIYQTIMNLQTAISELTTTEWGTIISNSFASMADGITTWDEAVKKLKDDLKQALDEQYNLQRQIYINAAWNAVALAQQGVITETEAEQLWNANMDKITELNERQVGAESVIEGMETGTGTYANAKSIYTTSQAELENAGYVDESLGYDLNTAMIGIGEMATAQANNISTSVTAGDMAKATEGINNTVTKLGEAADGFKTANEIATETASNQEEAIAARKYYEDNFGYNSLSYLGKLNFSNIYTSSASAAEYYLELVKKESTNAYMEEKYGSADAGTEGYYQQAYVEGLQKEMAANMGVFTGLLTYGEGDKATVLTPDTITASINAANAELVQATSEGNQVAIDAANAAIEQLNRLMPYAQALDAYQNGEYSSDTEMWKAIADIFGTDTAQADWMSGFYVTFMNWIKAGSDNYSAGDSAKIYEYTRDPNKKAEEERKAKVAALEDKQAEMAEKYGKIETDLHIEETTEKTLQLASAIDTYNEANKIIASGKGGLTKEQYDSWTATDRTPYAGGYVSTDWFNTTGIFFTRQVPPVDHNPLNLPFEYRYPEAMYYRGTAPTAAQLLAYRLQNGNMPSLYSDYEKIGQYSNAIDLSTFDLTGALASGLTTALTHNLFGKGFGQLNIPQSYTDLKTGALPTNDYTGATVNEGDYAGSTNTNNVTFNATFNAQEQNFAATLLAMKTAQKAIVNAINK